MNGLRSAFTPVDFNKHIVWSVLRGTGVLIPKKVGGEKEELKKKEGVIGGWFQPEGRLDPEMEQQDPETVEGGGSVSKVRHECDRQETPAAEDEKCAELEYFERRGNRLEG